jgi:hypothetical protein
MKELKESKEAALAIFNDAVDRITTKLTTELCVAIGNKQHDQSPDGLKEQTKQEGTDATNWLQAQDRWQRDLRAAKKRTRDMLETATSDFNTDMASIRSSPGAQHLPQEWFTSFE